MLNVAPIEPIDPSDPVAKGVVANPPPTGQSISSNPPLPPPPPGDYDSDDEDGDNGDANGGELDHGFTLSIVLESSTTSTLTVTSTSSASSSSIASTSSSSTPPVTSLTNSAFFTAEPSSSAPTSFYSSTTSGAFQSQISSESAAISSASIPTSTSLFSASSGSSSATDLPVGQTNSGLEHKAQHSPLSIAGIALASIFGFVALAAIMYLLHRFRHRRKLQASNSLDKEKQFTNAVDTQETGIIFGRRRSSPRGTSNLDTQENSQYSAGDRGRSRFSFLNRRWHSTGTQILNAEEQHQIGHDHTPSTSAPATSVYTPTAPPSPSRWPSPFFFTRNFHFPFRPTSHVASQISPQTPTTTSLPTVHEIHPTSTATTIPPDVSRTLSTRTTGSGHARAYAHHGISTPRFSAIFAARSTISSLSNLSFWLGRTERRRSEVSLPTSASPSPSRSFASSSLLGLSHDTMSTVSDLTRSEQVRSGRSTLLPAPLRLQGRENFHRPRSGVRNDIHQASATTTAGGGQDSSQSQRRGRTLQRVGSMPRLPLPVIVSRGSWGGDI